MNAAVLAVRFGAVAAALGAWFYTQRLLAGREPTREGVGDRLHEWTARLNARLFVNPAAANRVLIVSSAGIDAFGLFLLGASLFGPTFRPFVSLLALFALRQLCQNLCSLPVPSGAIWRHPGVPSLLVTYGTTNDFFFSGHTAVAVLGAIELTASAPGCVAVLGWAGALAEAFVVLVLRAHYTMDVVAAACAACCAWWLGGAAAPAVDLALRGLS